MIRPRPTKDGKTRYQVRKLKNIKVRTFATKGEANRYEKEQKKLRATRESFPDDFRENITVATAIEQFIEERFDSSQSSYKSRVSQLMWWKNHLGHMKLSQMDNSGRPVMSKHRSILKRSRCNSTVNCYMSAISTVFTFAMDEKGWMTNNPALRFHLKVSNGRMRFLSIPEQKKLLASTQESSNPHLYLIVLLALSTGGRKNEIRELKWSSVYFDKKRIILEKTKNGKIGVLRLSKKPLEELKKHYESRCKDSDFLFPRAWDFNNPITIRSAFAAALARCGIRDFHFHDIRHTFASNLAASGASLFELAKALRVTIPMVERYAHLTEQHSFRGIDKSNRKIFK